MKDPFIRRTNERIIAGVTAHRVPISVYFELEAYRDHVEYTASLDVASINNTPRLLLMKE